MGGLVTETNAVLALHSRRSVHAPAGDCDAISAGTAGQNLTQLRRSLALMKTPVRPAGLEVLPNPTPRKRVEDPDRTSGTRHLHCRRYNGCLDVAVVKGWRGFSCENCGAFEPLSPQGEYRDLDGLLDLMAAVATPSNDEEVADAGDPEDDEEDETKCAA